MARRPRLRARGDRGVAATTSLLLGSLFVLCAFEPMRSHLEAIAAATAQLDGVDTTVSITRLTVIYATLQLFTMNAPAVEAVDPPQWLAWARVLAPGVGVAGLVVGLNRVLRARIHSQSVRWHRGHEVLCCDEQEALRWAKGRARARNRMFAKRTLVVLPNLSEDSRRELQLLGVRPLLATDPEPSRGPFANAVSGAQRVIVDLEDDVSTLEFAIAAREVGSGRSRRTPARSVIAYVASPTLETLTTAICTSTGEEDSLSRIIVTSNEQQLARSMQLHRVGRRPHRGPLHLAVAGGGPDTAMILDAIVAFLEPAEEARVTLFLPLDTPTPRLPDRIPVDVVHQSVESIASAIQDLARQLASDPDRADLSSPILVHLDDAVRSVLVVAGLRPLKDVGQRVAVLPPSGTPGGSVLLEEFFDASEGSGSLKIIRPTDIGTVAHLDAVAGALADSMREWSHLGVCGKHPADGLLGLLSRPRPPADGVFPEDVLHNILISLDDSGLTLRPRRHDRAARAHFAMQHHIDRLAHDLGRPDLTDPEGSRSRDGLRGRTTLAHFVMHLDQLVIAACDLSFEATEKAPDPSWLEEDDLRSMARSIHELYRAKLPQHDRGRATDIPWEELGEVARESNLAQARRIPIKVAGLGLRLIPLDGVLSPGWPDGYEPSDLQLDELGELEHRLWSLNLFLRGFEHGPRGEASHPDLLPYGDLDAETRDKDRNTITDLPEVLAGAGLRLASPVDR